MTTELILNGKLALVTGITGDLGLSISKTLSEQGIRIIGITSGSNKKDNIKKKIESNKNILEILTCDLSITEDVENTCRYIEKNYSCPDIIINNAAVFSLKNLEKFNVKEIISTYNINIIAPMIICKFFIENLKKRKWGSVINICSSSSYNGGGTKGHTVYSSTKHALLGFSRALDEEVRKSNIRVGTISPAGISTSMMKNRDDIDKDSLMTTQEVSEAILFLLKSQGKGIAYELRLWRMLR